MDPATFEKAFASIPPRYQIGEAIGQGGMATVYRAWDTDDRLEVAIKILRPELAETLDPKRFRREIEVMRELSHPGILPVLDSGEAASLPFYVMPLIAGGSLAERLRREGQLPISDAVDITLKVGEGLSAAHDQGVVHRDIKPSNIFLDGSNVLIADFGIATFLDRADQERLTESGIAIGTAGYMSPEQVSGDQAIDARSDVYSLGCVLYEMLAGEPPFTGPTRQLIVAKQLGLPSPRIAAIRRTVPLAVDDVVTRALAKSPADRFGTIRQLSTTLAHARTDKRTIRSEEVSPAWFRLAGAGLALVLLASAAASLWRPQGSLDSMRYAVLPVEVASNVSQPVPTALVRDALARWTDVSVVDAFQVEESVADLDGRPMRQSDAIGIGLEHGARWVIRSRVETVGDSIRFQASLADTQASGVPARDASVRVPSGATFTDQSIAALIERLVLQAGDIGPTISAGTGSLAALRAFLTGEAALREGDLARADSGYTAAALIDDQFAHAHLWTAVARWWAGRPGPEWHLETDRALLGTSSLSPADRSLAEALRSIARDDLAQGCPRLADLIDLDDESFASWYSYARCLSIDDTVLPDPRSPSTWSFRTSHQRAIEAYQEAFRLRPSVLAGFRDDAYLGLRQILKLAGNQRRPGRSADGQRFVADPAWVGDSLAFVPYPLEVGALRLTADPVELIEAVRRQREFFRSITASWSSSAPDDVDAKSALAIGLGLLGERAALDTLRSARSLATTDAERQSVRLSEVTMLVAFAVPSDRIGLNRAKALADSILRDTSDGGSSAWALAGLAALTGRAERVYQLATQSGVANQLVISPPLWRDAPPLLALSALGGPTDTIAALETRVRSVIERELLPGERDRALRQWLFRPATLAFPERASAFLQEMEAPGDYLWEMQANLDRHDSTAVHDGLAEIQTLRADLLPGAVTLDAVYPEADLIYRLGDPSGAAAWLDPTLQALPTTWPSALSSPVGSGTLLRAAALRATLAEELGDDRAARDWAGVVAILWGDADPAFAPLVRRMELLAN